MTVKKLARGVAIVGMGMSHFWGLSAQSRPDLIVEALSNQGSAFSFQFRA
jgi:hypothetical protein